MGMWLLEAGKYLTKSLTLEKQASKKYITIDYLTSDGTVRIFTADASRTGSPEVLQAYEEEVSKTAIAAQQELGGMKISELPGPESLLREGRKDGDTKMVREGDLVCCYSWSEAEQKWSKVGEVVGASGATQNTSGKVLYEGKVTVVLHLNDLIALKLPDVLIVCHFIYNWF